MRAGPTALPESSSMWHDSRRWAGCPGFACERASPPRTSGTKPTRQTFAHERMSGRCKAKIVQKPSSVVGELRAVSTGVTPEKAVASSRDGLRENNFDLLRLVFAGI